MFLRKFSLVVGFLVACFCLFGPLVPVIHAKNDCLMTYMHPSYKRYAVNASLLSHRYRLFLYKEDVSIPREAIVAREAGIPVLFVHGSGGSFRQVRSIGSEAYRGFYGSSEYDKSLLSNGMGSSVLGELMGLGEREGNSLNAFDFWTVDFREELSGLSGVLLEKQTQFVVDAVHAILDHYDKIFIPRVLRARSVILLGHSMGGIVALSAAASPQLRSGAVASIVCMAAPLVPALVSDSTMARVYREMKTALPSLQNVSIASIGGGQRDWFVPSRLSVPPTWMRNSTFYIDSLSVARSHVDADHFCIVWCNQIVRAVVGGLFRGLDTRTRMLLNSTSARTRAMTRRLFGGPEAHRLGLNRNSVENRASSPQFLGGAAATQAIADIDARAKLESWDISKTADTSVLSHEICSVFNWTAPPSSFVSLALSRGAVRLVARFSSGRVADLSDSVVVTHAFHLDDPRAQTLNKVDHLLVRGVARLKYANMTQLMVCQNKTTFRKDMIHLCQEDRDNDCARLIETHRSASKLVVMFEVAGKVSEGAIVFAINHDDQQTRLFHSVKSGVPLSVRFESSCVRSNISIWILFPSNSTLHFIDLSPDYLAIFQDAVREMVPDVALLSLLFTCCFVLALNVKLNAMIVIGVVGGIVLTAVAVVIDLNQEIIQGFFLLSASSCVSVVVCSFARVLVLLLSRFGKISLVVFFALSFLCAAGCVFFGSVLFTIPLLIVLVPLVTNHSRAVALVTLLLFVLLGDTPHHVVWIHTLIHSDRELAIADSYKRFSVGFVVVLIMLSPDWLPKRFSRLLLTIVAALLFIAPLNSFYLIQTISLFAYFIVSQVRDDEQSKAKQE
jgi:pimeloyl-ACP methyl ester carboxylesterase